MQTDEGLVDEFKQSGDRRALDELTVRHIAKVRAMVLQMVLDSSRADDLTQEIFLRAYRGLPGFNGRSKFTTWLHRVALNTVYSYLDRTARSPVEYPGTLPDAAVSCAEQPERQALRSELAQNIERALAALSPPLRAAIVLTTLHGHDVREAASIADCNVSTMYWRIHEARKQLKTALAEYLQP